MKQIFLNANFNVQKCVALRQLKYEHKAIFFIYIAFLRREKRSHMLSCVPCKQRRHYYKIRCVSTGPMSDACQIIKKERLLYQMLAISNSSRTSLGWVCVCVCVCV